MKTFLWSYTLEGCLDPEHCDEVQAEDMDAAVRKMADDSYDYWDQTIFMFEKGATEYTEIYFQVDHSCDPAKCNDWKFVDGKAMRKNYQGGWK